MIDDLGECLTKGGLAVDGMLSGSEGDSVVGYLNKSYLEGGTPRARLYLVSSTQSDQLGEGCLVTSLV